MPPVVAVSAISTVSLAVPLAWPMEMTDGEPDTQPEERPNAGQEVGLKGVGGACHMRAEPADWYVRRSPSLAAVPGRVQVWEASVAGETMVRVFDEPSTNLTALVLATVRSALTATGA